MDYLEDFEIKDGTLIKYHGEGGDVTIPDSVTSISYRAFAGCESLTIKENAGSCAEEYAKKYKIKFEAI